MAMAACFVARVREDASHSPQLLGAIALAQVVLAQAHSQEAVRPVITRKRSEG